MSETHKPAEDDAVAAPAAPSAKEPQKAVEALTPPSGAHHRDHELHDKVDGLFSWLSQTIGKLPEEVINSLREAVPTKEKKPEETQEATVGHPVPGKDEVVEEKQQAWGHRFLAKGKKP